MSIYSEQDKWESSINEMNAKTKRELSEGKVKRCSTCGEVLDIDEVECQNCGRTIENE
jgi:hypothetical protein